MELAAIQATLRAEPFRPFTLRLVSGGEFVIPTPEHLYIPPNARRMMMVANVKTGGVTPVDISTVAAITVDGPCGPAPPAAE